MTTKNPIALKIDLLKACEAIQMKNVSSTQLAMKQAQESANEEKGTMGDKFESFREQLQIDRDMYARQYEEGMQVLGTLKRIDPNKKNERPALGAVVLTDSQNFFIAASLGQISIPEGSFVAISAKSPMFNAMAGKMRGDKFIFRDKNFVIKEIL